MNLKIILVIVIIAIPAIIWIVAIIKEYIDPTDHGDWWMYNS